METQDILYHLHERAIPIHFYERFPKLNDFFNILSINTFEDGTIVSTCEAKKYPIYLTQYHPEIVYEPALDINANREPDAYKIAFEFSNFFATECARSKHSFADLNEM